MKALLRHATVLTLTLAATTSRAATERISVRFAATPLATAVSEIATRAGATVEWLGQPEATTVSVELTEVSLDEALDRLVRPRSYFLVTTGNSSAPRRIVIMPGTEGRAQRAPMAAVRPAARSQAPSTVLDPEATSPAAGVLAALDDPDPRIRHQLLEQARDFDPRDPRRDLILSRLRDDADATLRTEANRLSGVSAFEPQDSEEF